MTVPRHISDAITRLVKPSGSKLSTRETIEAHADHIVREHNRMLNAMIHYVDTGELQSPKIKEWAAGINRKNVEDAKVMRGVLTGALVKQPAFQGLSDGQALEAYGRLLINLYNLEVIGQPPLA
jgi:hypothetical protein